MKSMFAAINHFMPWIAMFLFGVTIGIDLENDYKVAFTALEIIAFIVYLIGSMIYYRMEDGK